MSTVTQTSNFIDPTYPVAGQNNSTAGMRSNFSYIQQSFAQTSVELNKLQKTHLIFLGDATASSGQLDSASASGSADPNLNITLNLATVLTGGATLNTNTSDVSLTMDEKGRVIGKTTVTRNISWGSFGTGQAIVPPTSLGTGSGTLNWPALVFDALGRLTQVTTQSVTYGLTGHTLAKGSLLVGGAGNTSLALSPPSTGKWVLGHSGNTSSGLEWFAQSTTTQTSITTGRWYANFDNVVKTYADTVGLNTLRLAPFIVPVTMTIDQLAEVIETTSTSGNLQLGLYASDSVTKMPVGTPLGTTASLSTSFTGPVSGPLKLSGTNTPILVQAGTLLWYGVMSDNGTAKVLMCGKNQSRYARLVGSAILATIAQDLLGTVSIAQVASVTFGTWPNLTSNPAGETSNTAEPAPIIHTS